MTWGAGARTADALRKRGWEHRCPSPFDAGFGARVRTTRQPFGEYADARVWWWTCRECGASNALAVEDHA